MYFAIGTGHFTSEEKLHYSCFNSSTSLGFLEEGEGGHYFLEGVLLLGIVSKVLKLMLILAAITFRILR